MGITVGDALQLDVFKQARLVAGETGVNREILFVDVLEVPDVDPWIRPNILLMTTAFSIKNDEEKQQQLVRTLAKIGAAALVIKPGRFIDAIPIKLLEIGDELGLPIIELPLEIPYIEVINSVLGIILDKQSTLIKWGEELHKKLTHTVLRGGGLLAIAETLAQVIKNPVFIEDEDWNLLAYVAEDEHVQLFQTLGQQRMNMDLCQLKFPTHIALIDENQGTKQIVAPVMVGNKQYGTVTIISLENSLEDFKITAVEHTATVVALEIMKQKAVLETEIRLQREFIDDLLLGSFEDERTIIKRGQYLGWDLTKEFSVMNVDIDDFEQYSAKMALAGEQALQQMKDKMFILVKKTVGQYEQKPIVAHRSDSFVILLDTKAKRVKTPLNQYIREIGENICKEVVREFADLSVSIGIGRPYSRVAHLSKSYLEARQALKIGRTAWGKGGACHFNELGIYRLLITHQSIGDMTRFYEDFLQPLVFYDQQNGTELVHSLEQYFQYNCNAQLTSEQLFLHRNTLNYRLKRIKEILGLSLDNAEDRLCLEVALKIKSILDH